MKYFGLSILFISITGLVCSQPHVAKKKFALFMLAGQSNMAGRGVVEPQDKVSGDRIWMLTKNGDWALAAEPLHFDKPGITGVGPGLAFARRLLQLDTSLVIGLIPAAVGGTSINVWQPGAFDSATKTHPYDDALSRTKKAIQTGTLKGILWQQGESDCDSLHRNGYEKKLAALVKHFRKDLRLKNLPFAAGTIGSFYLERHPSGIVINQAIEDLPNLVKRTVIVSSSGLTDKGDAIHFNSASARELGLRYANIFYQTFGTK